MLLFLLRQASLEFSSLLQSTDCVDQIDKAQYSVLLDLSIKVTMNIRNKVKLLLLKNFNNGDHY